MQLEQEEVAWLIPGADPGGPRGPGPPDHQK